MVLPTLSTTRLSDGRGNDVGRLDRDASSDPTFRWRIHTESDQSSRPTRSASERLIGPQSCVLCSYVKSRQAASISNSEQRLTFFGDSFFLVPFCSFPSLLRPPRRFSGSPRRFLRFPVFTRILFPSPSRSRRFLFPDSSGTFFSPSSDELKQGGRKRSIQLARGKLKNSLVSNNQDKSARNCPAKINKRFLRVLRTFSRSFSRRKAKMSLSYLA